jgi:hypothetical protein
MDDDPENFEKNWREIIGVRCKTSPLTFNTSYLKPVT